MCGGWDQLLQKTVEQLISLWASCCESCSLQIKRLVWLCDGMLCFCRWEYFLFCFPSIIIFLPCASSVVIEGNSWSAPSSRPQTSSRIQEAHLAQHLLSLGRQTDVFQKQSLEAVTTFWSTTNPWSRLWFQRHTTLERQWFSFSYHWSYGVSIQTFQLHPKLQHQLQFPTLNRSMRTDLALEVFVSTP